MENITPKEKAKELIEKYSFVEIAYYTSIFEVKQCAIIAVEEILLEVNSLGEEFTLRLDGTRQYWDEVKQEIEKI